MDYLKIVENMPIDYCISKEDILEITHSQNVDVQDSSVFWLIRKMIESGVVVRKGRNSYCRVPKDDLRMNYSYSPSEKMQDVIAFLENEHPELNFQAWELLQVNEFLVRKIAHNTIFVDAENRMQKSIYESLREEYGRNVLFRPSVDIFNLYGEDGTIIVSSLVSETPTNKSKSHLILLEKLLVDLLTNKIVSQIVPKRESVTIYEEAFEKYHIDETRLLRYASRRNAEDKIRRFIKGETDICLLTESEQK